MKQIAILGPTASGKSSLAISVAQKTNSDILSLDSLSVYKEVDIASAKPTLHERKGIKHWGIDVIYPNEKFSAVIFFKLYEEAKAITQKEGKNLIIVGGTSFYLKSMIDGLSPTPKLSSKNREKTQNLLLDLKCAYDIILKNDKAYADKISSNDSYRIQKWLEIYYETGMGMSEYFAKYKKEPIIKDIAIYDILIDREKLKERISKRTALMFQDGLVDEVCFLEKKYTRAPNSMKAIGIKEVLEYLDGKISLKEAEEKISLNTAGLAKRQQTFNRAQFENIISKPIDKIENEIISYFGF